MLCFCFRWIALTFIGLNVGLTAHCHASESTRPNIVLIMADDLGYGDLSCYDGWIQTPHIDELSKGGLKFLDFHSNGVVCSPTRAALVSGKYQQRLGIPSVINAKESAPTHRNGIQANHVTIAELLRDSGYQTAIFGKWHLGYYAQHNPVKHGFNSFRGYVSGNVDFFSHVDQAGRLDWWINELKKDESGYVTHLINRHAVDFVRKNRSKPFFMYVAHEAPHYPYQGPNDRAERKVGGSFVPHGKRKDKKNAYREMVSEMDKGVGQIVSVLRELKLEDKTLIIFISDNGAAKQGSNAPLRGHKGTVWEGGHRVPGLFYWKGKTKPGKSTQTAMTMDIAPTLLSVAKIESKDENAFDGIDLSPTLYSRKSLTPRTLFWDTGRAQAVRRGPWKLVQNKNAKHELFNLTNDVAEKHNLAESNAQTIGELQAALRKWQDDVSE